MKVYLADTGVTNIFVNTHKHARACARARAPMNIVDYCNLGQHFGHSEQQKLKSNVLHKSPLLLMLTECRFAGTAPNSHYDCMIESEINISGQGVEIKLQ